MYSEVMGHSSIPASPDLVYEQGVQGGNKRLSIGEMVIDTEGGGPYHESDYTDIPLTQSGKYISCLGRGHLNNIYSKYIYPDPLIDVTL